MVKEERVLERRRRKALRNNIQDITKPVVRQFARRGGAKHIYGSKTWGVLDHVKVYAVE